MSSEQDNNINYQTLTNAWCECESKLKDQQPQHEDQFEYSVPQVDTEITLNLSGNEVCDIENFIPDYQVSSLPYASVSRLNEEATLTSAHIKSCQQLNSSGLSLNQDDNDLLPVAASDVGHSSNSDNACNPSDTEGKLRTPEPPLILDDSGELPKVASDESCSEEAKTNESADENKEIPKSNFTSVSCKEFIILPTSSSDKKSAIEKTDKDVDEKMITGLQSPKLQQDSSNRESTKDKVDDQLNAKLKNLKVQSRSNENDEKMITLVAQVIDSGPQLENLTASVSYSTSSDTNKDLNKSLVIHKESFDLQPSNNKVKVNQPISLDMLTIVNEAAPKSQINSATINDASQKQGIALSSIRSINKSDDKMTPIAQLANQKRVVVKQEFVDVARQSPIVHIKSSIPTGSMTKISNLKAIPFMKPVYKFDKVSIKTLSGSTSLASPKPGLLRPGATVHRLNLTGPLHKPSQLQSNSGSKLAGTATLEKPKSIFSFLKSGDQRHGGGAEKFKTIGNRIVVPVDIRKRSTSSLLNKPVVVTIKKPITSTPSSSQTNPTKFSMASGSVMHRLSSFSNNVKGTSNSNPPSVIKRLSHISNMNKNKVSLRQPMRTLQTHKSPSYNNNLPYIRQYKAVGSKIVSLSSTPSSPDSSPSRFPAFGSGGASLLRKTNWIKREIKQEENNSYGKSYNGMRTGGTLHQPQDVFDELTNLDWLIKDDDRSLFREIRKLNPDDPGIGMSGDESDDNSASAARRNNKHIFTAYSKVYGPNYYGNSRAPTDYEYDPNSKPPYSFSSLIFMAVEDSDEKKLPVKEIYLWVCRHFPFYRTAPSGWKNSIRHNLSLNRCFMKAPIPNREKESAKGALWCIDPAYRTNLVQALKRSPYYPYLHPAGFKSSEPLRNLADLLPGVKREQEESAAKAKQESDPARLWADPQMASAALELMRLKNFGHLNFPPDMDSSSMPSAVTAAAKQEASYYRNYSGGGERTTSSESSIEGERLVITKPNQEHTYSSPTAGSSGKKGQHLVKKKKKLSPESSSAKKKHHHQERRSGSPASGGSEKSGPDAAYEFEVGDFIDEINMMEVGNEVEIVSNASSSPSSSSDEEADDDNDVGSSSSSEEDDDQALFDSGFSSLKQYRNAQHEPLPASSRRRTPKKTRRRRRSFSPTSPRHHANSKRRNSKPSADKTPPSAVPGKRSSGRRSKKLPPSLEQPTRRKLTYGSSRSVGRPRKHEVVEAATTSKKRKTDASLLSAKRSRSSTKEVNVARGKVGRPRGSKTRKLLMSSAKSRLNLPTSTDGEKNDRVAPPPKLRSSVSSHYHTRSSGHKLLPQSSSATRKRRSKKASESSSSYHHNHRENGTDEDHLSDEHMLAKADEQILAAANCLMSFATNFDMSRSTSSVDTQNTQ